MSHRILNSGVEQRKPGGTPVGDILQGQPIQMNPADDTGASITAADGTTEMVGFADVSNIVPVSASVDYDNYNRGGKVGYICGAGVELALSNADGRGAPFDTTQTYHVGQKVYVSAAKKVTNQSNGTVIGVVTKAPVSALDELIIILK